MAKVLDWLKPYPELVLDGKSVFCKACSKLVSCGREYLIDQHASTPLHKRNCDKLKATKQSQTPLRESFIASSQKNQANTFKANLCKALIASNIPLKKLENPILKSFLEKYCKLSVPDESTMMKEYLQEIYHDTMDSIRRYVTGNYIYFIVDEATDACGRYIANLMVRILNENFYNKPFLDSVKQLEKTNSTTISKFIQDSLTQSYLPKAIPSDNVLLMVSDAAPYMLKAGQNLNILYNNLIHIACLAHGVNRVAEEIREQFPLVNDLISNVKKVFVKVPLRVAVNKEKLPNTPLPPQPVVTRWGTWLEAALFYAKHFKDIKEIVFGFSDASLAIKESKSLFNKPELPQKLDFIKSHYTCVSEAILKLETQGMLLTESTQLVSDLKNSINSANGTYGKSISKKMESVIQKNEGFGVLRKCADVLNGIPSDLDLNPDIIAALKYDPSHLLMSNAAFYCINLFCRIGDKDLQLKI